MESKSDYDAVREEVLEKIGGIAGQRPQCFYYCKGYVWVLANDDSPDGVGLYGLPVGK